MKLLFLSGLLIILVIVAAGLFGLVANQYGTKRWDGINRFTLVVLDRKNRSAQIQSIDPETKQGVRLDLPGDMEINTISGRGVWKISSVVALTEKYGSVWAADSICNFLGIPYTSIRDNIDIWDKISWWNLSRNASWQDINLNGTDMVSESYAPDGEKVLGLTSWWQDKAGDLFYSSNLAKEGLNVEVYNTTDVTGLAAGAAQILENAGVLVTMVDQSDLDINKCLVYSLPAGKNDPGIKWIVRNFNCDWKGQPGMNNQEVKVYIGGDYAKWIEGGNR
jgi:hypothetical protein